MRLALALALTLTLTLTLTRQTRRFETGELFPTGTGTWAHLLPKKCAIIFQKLPINNI